MVRCWPCHWKNFIGIKHVINECEKLKIERNILLGELNEINNTKYEELLKAIEYHYYSKRYSNTKAEAKKDKEINTYKGFNEFIKNKICGNENGEQYKIYQINICYKINEFNSIKEKIKQKNNEI